MMAMIAFLLIAFFAIGISMLWGRRRRPPWGPWGRPRPFPRRPRRPW
jgi:hypothetical protein